MIHDRPEQTIQVLSGVIIVLDEGVEASVQVGAYRWGVVPPHGLIAQMEFMLIVV